ncbi:MAG TPA: hypothetical protein VNL16_08585, partial [Chloroflexota bacterium]|nr:hypothetical protein [Chloroflexota bacterium]
MEKTRQRARTSAIRPVLMIPLVAAIGLLALFGCAPGHPVSSGKAVPVAVGSKGSVPVPPPGSSSQPPTRPRTASAANPVQTVPGARDLTQQTIDGQPAFGVVGRAPFVESLTLTGATHTVDGVVAVGQKDQVVLHWIVATNQPLALDHVVFAADHQEKATTALPADGIVLPPDAQALPLPNLADGRWYLHLWAVDQAGQISPPATVAVSVLRTPPELSHAVYRSWATNPLYQTVPIRFTVSRAATLA